MIQREPLKAPKLTNFLDGLTNLVLLGPFLPGLLQVRMQKHSLNHPLQNIS